MVIERLCSEFVIVDVSVVLTDVCDASTISSSLYFMSPDEKSVCHNFNVSVTLIQGGYVKVPWMTETHALHCQGAGHV